MFPMAVRASSTGCACATTLGSADASLACSDRFETFSASKPILKRYSSAAVNCRTRNASSNAAYRCICRGMRLQILSPEKVALLPLAAACTNSLKQFQQVYLSGQEVPSLYITYYKHSGPHAEQHVSVPAMPLETALQETLFHPAIAVPKVEGVGGGLGSHASQMAPPMGLVRFVEEEVEQWMEAGGLQRLHAASHKDIRSLLQDPNGVSASPNVSFGLKQLVPRSVPSESSRQSSSYYPTGHNAQQPQQSFPQLLVASNDSEHLSDAERPVCFRQITVKNDGDSDVQLLDVRFSQKLPLWPNTMALTDDAGVSAIVRGISLDNRFKSLAVSSHPDERKPDLADQQQHRQRRKKKKKAKHQQQQQSPVRNQQQQQQQSQQSLPAGQQSSSPEKADSSDVPSPKPPGKLQDGLQGVLLQPGQEYPVTVLLNCLDGPFRKSESGVLSQLVVFTLLVKKSSAAPDPGLNQQAASSAYASNSSTSGAPPAPLVQRNSDTAKPQETIGFRDGSLAHVVVVGRQVSVCLVSKSDAADQQKMLNVEVKPFVPESLRALFDQQPTSFVSSLGPQAALLDKGLANSSKSQPACQQGPVSEEPGLQGGTRPVQGPLGAQVRKWVRLLRLEESAMYQDIKRFDMFNVKLNRVKFDANERTYTLQGLPKDEPDRKKRYPYRGPKLQGLFKHNKDCIRDQKAKLPILFTLQVPGLVEKRPNLIIGDMVYLRFAAKPEKEWSCWVVVVQDTQCMLCVPKLDSQPDEAVTELVHVRFTFDRTPFRRMLRALRVAGVQAQTMQLLPPQVTNSESVPGSSPTVKAGLPSDDLFREALVSPAAASILSADKTVHAATAGKLQKTAASIEELGAQKLNSQQREAVASVLVGAGGGRYPLALFGPPGTGKTVTLVECALQVYRTVEGARLLLCAPQNYSADLLFKALAAAGITNRFMIRLNDPRIPPAQVQEDVRPRCLFNEDTGYFGLPSPEQLATYHIVVCTCGAAGMLREGDYASFYQRACHQAAKGSTPGSRPLEFTHVMIDEAGQALGPEALIPLTLLTPKGGCAMLCGDPRQLGPVLHSPAAEMHGLKTSLLEAFVQFHATQSRQDADLGLAPCLGMLVHNYRSHSRLLELPSRLYYDNQLLASAEPSLVTAPHWSELQRHNREEDERQGEEEQSSNGARQQNEGISQADESETSQDGASQLPVNTLFYGVRGQQMRDGEAPSYYNPVEASTLVKLLQGLLAHDTGTGRGVTVQDVGVIATYRNQVKKLRLLLRARELGAVRVGTVDDFQGQEARIIFISTVLSRPADGLLGGGTSKGGVLTPQGVAADPAVGFFRNPNRFNVAITRAQALMVVLGHPLVLMQDPNWSELVKYCAARGAYRGAGSEALGQLVRNQPSDDSYLPGEDAGEPMEEDSLDIQQAVNHIAEAAVLGVGDASKMFPEFLEEMYESYATHEMEFRVIL